MKNKVRQELAKGICGDLSMYALKIIGAMPTLVGVTSASLADIAACESRFRGVLVILSRISVSQQQPAISACYSMGSYEHTSRIFPNAASP